MAIHSANSADREERFGEIVFGYLQAAERGETIDRRRLVTDHPEFAVELEQFLGNLDGVGRLATPLRALLNPMEPPPAGTLGDFRLLREVGRGGMGIVYEAEQISLNRKVALKVLPFAATMDPRHLQRFRNEAQAAACLHHPNIVPVHGVGCDRGVHYYAMQLIEGQTLAQLIEASRPVGRAEASRSPRPEPDAGLEDSARPTPGFLPSPPASGGEGMGVRGDKPSTAPNALLSTKRDRAHFRHIAELIASAADALEYAHSMGVVHRDIKPGNLMIDFSPLPASGRGAGGEGCHLWITDFGLAKLANPAREGGGELTMTGDLLGTLRYMSPEQALAKHGLVDHRTDIYSLGATLYELLTLKPAVAGADKAEILKAIAWEEPTPLRKHDKSIPAELETITLKCLAKEPGERYAAAGEVAEDLRRWLGDRAIKAKPPGWREKAAKWGRRHKGVVWSATALFLFAIASLIIGTYFVWRERQRALEQTAITDAINTFLLEDLLLQNDVGEQANRGFRPDQDLTVKTALDRAAKRIESRFADQPRIAAALHSTIGRSYDSVGEMDLGIVHLEIARHYNQAYLSPHDLQSLQTLLWLGLAYMNSGRLEQARQTFEIALPLHRAKFGPHHRETLDTMRLLAGAYRRLGRHEDAHHMRAEALELYQIHLGPDNRETLNCMMGWASDLEALGRHAEALAIQEIVVPKKRALLADDHPDLLHDRADLAISYAGVGRHSQALALNLKTRAILESRAGSRHWLMVMVSCNSAENLASLGRDAEAISLIDETLRHIGERKYYPDFTEQAISLRLRVSEKLKDPAGCRATAEMWEKLNRTDGKSMLMAARLRAATSAVIRACDKSEGGGKLAHMEAERAVEWLRKAVAAGVGLDQIRGSKDFESLRATEAFAQILGSHVVRQEIPNGEKR